MKDLSRRVFLERIGAGTLGGVALSQALTRRATAQSDASESVPGAAAWAPPGPLTNPNILIILVDQMRWPLWLSPSQMTILSQQILPNIFGRLRRRSYVFQEYYTAATTCVAARGTLLT